MRGRKRESTPGDVDQIKAQLARLAEENETLRNRLVDLETMRGGGSVPVLSGPVDDDESSPVRVEYGGDEPDLGPIYLCRLMTTKVPAGTRTAVTVSIIGSDRRGKKYRWARRIITEASTPIPEDIINRLETPQTDEFEVPPESTVYEAFLRGNLEPAQEEARAMGFDKVIAKPTGIKYIRYIRNYTVVKEGMFQGGVITPQVVGVTRG